MSTKRILYVTNTIASVYVWHGRRLTGPTEFATNEVGRVEFARYLETEPGVVTYVLVDFIEEEFRIENVPHVRRQDRAALLKRRIDQHYRSTPYRNAKVQGRSTVNAREDEVIISALTNPELIKTWLDVLLEKKTPVHGIYSLPLLATKLFKSMRKAKDKALVITRQHNGGARQAFFLNGKLKMSRLSPVGDLHGAAYADLLLAEIDKARRYLTRLKMLARDDSLTVYCVGGGADLETLRARFQDAPGVRYEFVTVTEIAQAMHAVPDSEEFADALYLHLLVKRTPPKSYASASEKRYEHYRRARVGMYGAAAIIAIVCATWTGANVIDARLLKEFGSTAQKLSGEVDTRTQDVLEKIPKTPVTPENLKLGVEIADTIRAEQSLPHPMMIALSGGMRGLPQVRVQSIEWEATRDPANTTFMAPSAQTAANGAPPPAEGAVSADIYQVAVMKGKITPFNGNFREAFETVDHLIANLRKQPGVTQAEALEMPLNTKPQATLSGQTGMHEFDQTALFTVRAVLKVPHETH